MMDRFRFDLVLCALLGLSALSAAQPAPTPKSCLDRLSAGVEALLAKDQPRLFAWHLRSLRSLAQSEYAKLALGQAQSARVPVSVREKEFVDYVSVLAKCLETDGADPDLYLKHGRRGLVLARPAQLDGSLQYMMVDLPKGWDPTKEYPLFVGLHGSGPDNPLAYPSFGAGPLGPEGAPGLTSQMIRLAPWGRGNRSWRNDAEVDLFEAIAVLKSFAKLDADRWYLTGHSSGADGAWAILQHTPDLWAAAGLQSGSMLWGRPEWGLIPNLANVPTYFLIGEKDDLPFRIPDNKEAYRVLSEMGAKTQLSILPGVGHYPLSEEGLRKQTEWMVAFKRTRPDRFSFTIDQAQHPGVWGIRSTMNPWANRLLVAPWPSFECNITGQEVRITTKRMEEVSIDLGSSGLRMYGEVRVWLNGKSVHRGPVPTMPLVLKTGKG